MSHLYFKTKKDSETGKKLSSLIDRANKAKEQLTALAEEIGADQKYSTSGWYVMNTGVNGVVFYTEPDMKIWKRVSKDHSNLYYPRSTKVAEGMRKKFEALDKIRKDDLNNVVGYGQVFNTIGYNLGVNSDYYGFVIMSEWGHTMPEDCEEVTGTEYEKL